MGIFKFVVNMFLGFFVFFMISGIFVGGKSDKKTEGEPVVESVYPIKFQAAFNDRPSMPTLYVDVGPGRLTMDPLVKKNFDFEPGRLIYFGDETEPIGFEMTVIGEDGIKRKAVFHRNRPKFHTWYSSKVRYGETADEESISKIAKAAGYNILCLDMTKL